MSSKTKTYSIDRYRREANIRPFVLETDDGEIVIQPPDGDDFMELGSVNLNDGRRMLSLMCGDQYDEVMEIVGSEPAPVLIALCLDMFKHFGLTDSGSGPGGQRALPR